MQSPRVLLPLPLPPTWADLRAELGTPGEFPADVLAEARDVAAATLPSVADRTELPLVTLDPLGSVDLDQALHLARTETGWRVCYAIADVAVFVRAGGAIDAEARRRGVTLYAPDGRVPLHPPALSEGAASLLPDVDRPALLWVLDVSADGTLVGTHVSRALVRSREQLDYGAAQQALDAGRPHEQMALLAELGPLLVAQARARDAVDIPTPDQEVADGDVPRLTFRAQSPLEVFNAQISLLTGRAAARLMLDGGIGLLRTLPAPDAADVEALRRSALALGLPWASGASYGDVVSALDPHDPRAAALLTLATRLLRGAGYTAFDGSPPVQPLHSAVAAPYAHVTAPLRRLADRFVGEVCLALCAGEPVPGWAREALPSLPGLMSSADQRASALDRAVVSLAEAILLAHRVGETFDAVVVESSPKGGAVQLAEPAVRAKLSDAAPPLGERVQVVLTEADPAARRVTFRLV